MLRTADVFALGQSESDTIPDVGVVREESLSLSISEERLGHDFIGHLTL